MNNYSLMNIILLLTTLLFAGLTLWMLLKRVKEKKHIVTALEANQAAFDSQFAEEENQLKQTIGEELATKLDTKIVEIVSVEKEAYKKLCTVFIEHQAAAIELLPFTMSKIIVAYIECISEIVRLHKEIQVGDTVSLEENGQEGNKPVEEEEGISQSEALIEQLRFEKLAYSDKYKAVIQLLHEIYRKYKDKLEITESDEHFATMNIDEIAKIFKIEPVQKE